MKGRRTKQQELKLRSDFWRMPGFTIAAAIVTLLILMLQGCGNGYNVERRYLPNSSKDQSPEPYDYFGDSSGCTQEPSILPVDVEFYTGSGGRYRACRETQTADKFRLEGQARFTDTGLCVFAGQTDQFGNVIPVQKTGTLGIVHQCLQIVPDGMTFVFPNVIYNYIFVIERTWENAMEVCLQARDYPSCPTFSHGALQNR